MKPMTDSKKSQPISPSSIARIAGNILSGMPATTDAHGRYGYKTLDLDHALWAARYIAKKAAEQSE